MENTEQAATPQVKTCRECGRELPLTAFKKTRFGEHVGVCTECVNAKRKPYRRKPTPARDIYSVPATNGCNPLLKDFKARELIEELRARGYQGTLRYVHEIEL